MSRLSVCSQLLKHSHIKAFRSADVDLELVSDAEFEANAEAMGVELNDEVRADPHLLRLAQLKFELAQRNR